MPTDHALTRAANSGDRLTTLIALRDTLAETIESTRSARDVAALARRLQSVLAEIEEIEARTPTASTPLDELRARRAAAGKTTVAPVADARGNVRR